uniref:AAA family ATPase n=1 Tax=Gemmiger formicilis TaxID=745368 RepID=UPI004026BCE9
MVGRLRTIDARTLADAVLEPPGYAVKDLLVQGLHILAGAPKTGKSWLALWLCQQVAGGEKVWGHPTQQGTVLYLCLEDGYRRLQDRLLDITEDPSENLYLATHAGTLADGLAGQIETFVREHGRVSLIVIDTLQKVRETCTDNTYARDYADLARLKELADRCKTTVLLVHHLRKQYDSDPLNRVSGTAGMSGAADGTFILQREDRSSNYGTLFCTGRDIESKELKLQFDPMSHIWECREDEETARSADEEVIGIVIDWLHDEKQFEGTASELLEILHDALPCELRPNILSRWLNKHKGMLKANGVSYTLRRTCALPGFVDSKNEEKTERNAGYLVVSHSGGGMLRQGTRKGIRRTPANRGMRAHWVVKGLDISEDVCHGMCP